MDLQVFRHLHNWPESRLTGILTTDPSSKIGICTTDQFSDNWGDQDWIFPKSIAFLRGKIRIKIAVRRQTLFTIREREFSAFSRRRAEVPGLENQLNVLLGTKWPGLPLLDILDLDLWLEIPQKFASAPRERAKYRATVLDDSPARSDA